MSRAEPRTESIVEIEKICNRVTAGNRIFTAMNPVSKEVERIFLAVMDGDNHINGFTNASIRNYLFPEGIRVMSAVLAVKNIVLPDAMKRAS